MKKIVATFDTGKMTKSARHTFYIDLKKYIEGKLDCDFGLCFYITKFTGTRIDAYKWVILKEELPELFALKPKKVTENDYWFPADEKGWAKRFKLLDKVIESTKDK